MKDEKGKTLMNNDVQNSAMSKDALEKRRSYAFYPGDVVRWNGRRKIGLWSMPGDETVLGGRVSPAVDVTEGAMVLAVAKASTNGGHKILINTVRHGKGWSWAEDWDRVK